MNALTPAALANADILRRIKAGPLPNSLSAAAVELDRADSSNLRRSLNLLITDGLVAGETGKVAGLTITTAGELALQAIAVAAGEVVALGDGSAAAAQLTVPWRDLRKNPFNVRKTRDPNVTAARAESVYERGILQALLVSPPDASGARIIWDGEGRYESVGVLIQTLRATDDFPMPCNEREATEEEALLIGLEANGNREDVDLLDRAYAWLTLVDKFGWSARRLALTQGIEPRVVQEWVKVAREATEANLADYRSGKINGEDLRKTVRTAKEGEAPAGAEEAAPPATGDAFSAQVKAVVGAQTDLEKAVGEQVDLTNEQELTLLEVLAAATERPGKSKDGKAAVLSYGVDLAKEPKAALLAAYGFLAFQTYPALAILTPQGQDYLGRQAWAYNSPAERLRAARKRLGLDEQKIAELEAQDTYHNAWLNERGRPRKVPIETALILLEVHHATMRGGDTWRGTEIRRDYDQAVLGRLVKEDLLRGPTTYEHRLYAKITWEAEKILDRWYPDWKQKKKRAAFLRDLRGDVIGEKARDALLDDQLATAWLNGPFEVPAEVQAELDQEAATEKARQDRIAAEAAARQEAEAAKAAALQAFIEAAPAMPFEERAARLREYLKADGIPAPWGPPENDDYSLGVSAGSHVRYWTPGATKLLWIAVNVAAGIAPEDWSRVGREESLDLDRAAFEAAIANAFMEEEEGLGPELAARHAAAALALTLQADGIEFGAKGYAWTSQAAEAIAGDYFEDLFAEPPVISGDVQPDAEAAA